MADMNYVIFVVSSVICCFLQENPDLIYLVDYQGKISNELFLDSSPFFPGHQINSLDLLQ